MILNYNKENITDIIKENKKVVFFFHKENCARCVTLEREIKNFLQAHDTLVYSVDASDNLSLLRKLNIYAIPALLIYHDAIQVYRNLGYIDFEEVKKYC